MGHIIYSPLQKAFVSLSTEEKLPFSAEEFSDVKELRALSELIGPYGMRYMGKCGIRYLSKCWLMVDHRL